MIRVDAVGPQMGIPRNLGHIWIGPRPAPHRWMDTWIHKHPNWNYSLFDNDFCSARRFRNQKLIDEYMKRAEYSGAADLIRYEILLERGGFIPEADSICLENTDELFANTCAYTVYENEFVRGKLVSPILACQPNNPFVAALVERLNDLRPVDLDVPWKSTGNYFLAYMIEELEPAITIFPSHYFIPQHYTGRKYVGTDKIYARQFFGATTGKYMRPSALASGKMFLGKLRSWLMRKRTRDSRNS